VEWKKTEELWEMAPTNGSIGWDIPEDDPHRLAWRALGEMLVTTAHALSHGWLSVEGGIEVSMEVCSDTGNLAEERAACRCFCIRTDLSFQPDRLFILQHCRYFRWKLHIPWFPSRS
jgi:hypothetical protein